mgnify:CR=1 FL=1
MEIITKGQLPGEKMYQKTCSNCSTVFRFQRKECRVEHERQVSMLAIKCPLPGCGTEVYASDRDLVQSLGLGGIVYAPGTR